MPKVSTEQAIDILELTYVELKEAFYPLDDGSTIDDRLAMCVGLVLGTIDGALTAVRENRVFSIDSKPENLKE